MGSVTPEEVEEIISQLREAAETLEWVRDNLSKLKIGASSNSLNGRNASGSVGAKIFRGVVFAEAALRAALEPTGTSTFDDL